MALFLFGSMHAQPRPERYTTSYYSIEDGLSHRQVNAIAQDDRGFLWLGTEGGLDRFDGYEFRRWGEGSGLHTGPVSQVVVDGEDWLWVGQHGSEFVLLGLSFVHTVTGEVRSFAERYGGQVNESELQGEFIGLADGSVLCFDRSGDLLRFVDGRVDRRKVQWPDSITDRQPAIIDVLPEGSIWCVVRPAMVVELAPDGRVLRAVDLHAPVHQRLFRSRLGKAGRSSYFMRPRVGGTGELWRVGGPNGVSKVADLLDDRFDDFGICLRQDLPDGTSLEHWILQDAQGNKVLDLGDRFPTAHYRLLFGFLDRSGNTWVGGDFGLYHLSRSQPLFQRWLYSEKIPRGFGKRCRGLTQWNGRLCVNTEQDGYFELSLYDGTELANTDHSGTGFLLRNDGAGGRWVDRQDSLVHIGADGKWRAYACGWETWSLLANTAERGLLLGQRQGIRRLMPGTGVCEPYDGYGEFPELAEAFVMAMETDREGNVWLCTDQGLYRLQPGQGVMERFSKAGTGRHYLPHNAINQITQEGFGSYWLATGGGGLLLWNSRTGEFRQWGRAEGMPSSIVHAVYIDDAQRLWMPTEGGLACFDVRSGEILTYGTMHGISHEEFNRLSHLRLSDGRLCFGGLNGVTVVDPSKMNGSRKADDPPLVITGLSMHDSRTGQRVDHGAELRSTGRIVIRPEDHWVELGVSLLSYTFPTAQRYAWKVEGFHSAWNEQSSPRITFGDLPYGEWPLRIRARDANGNWASSELELVLDVVRPVYMRWWFLVLCVLVLLLLLRLWGSYRTKGERAMEVVRERIANDLRTEVAPAIDRSADLHEASTPTNPARDEGEAGESIARALHALRDAIWVITPGHDNGKALVERLRKVADDAAASLGCPVHFDVDPAISSLRPGMDQRQGLLSIFKALMDNTVQHSACSAFRVELVMDGRDLVMRVSDNGRGFDPAEQEGGAKGSGSQLIRQRAEAMGAQLLVDSSPRQGTRVEFRCRMT